MPATLDVTSTRSTRTLVATLSTVNLQVDSVGRYVGSGVGLGVVGLGVVGLGVGLGVVAGVHAAPSPRSQQSVEPHGATRLLPDLA
tara:strand:+ start:345 stop:602 length:258 start_codon:yes stop_codon:yes gene_type:complete